MWELPREVIRSVGSLGLYVGSFLVLFAALRLLKNPLRRFVKNWTFRKKRDKGFLVGYQAMMFCLVSAGLLFTASFKSRPHYVYQNLRVRRLVGNNSLDLVSPETGPFTADFCPTPPLQQYEPKAGYVLCRLSYVDRGCMDISSRVDGFIWVKDKTGITTILSDTDTFQPWPKCVKDEGKPSA